MSKSKADTKQMDAVLLGMNAISYVKALVSRDQAEILKNALENGLDLAPIAGRLGHHELAVAFDMNFGNPANQAMLKAIVTVVLTEEDPS